MNGNIIFHSSLSDAVKGYRWDLENGTSILWIPETSDSEFKELIITYTDDITEVVPPLGKDKNGEVTKDHSCLDYLFME